MHTGTLRPSWQAKAGFGCAGCKIPEFRSSGPVVGRWPQTANGTPHAATPGAGTGFSCAESRHGLNQQNKLSPPPPGSRSLVRPRNPSWPGQASPQCSLHRKTSVKSLRRSGAENTLLESCMYSRLTCAKKHKKPSALRVVGGWPWVGKPAGRRTPTKARFQWQTLK